MDSSGSQFHAVDLHHVAVAAGMAGELDLKGRTHFAHRASDFSLAVRGRTSSCDLALVGLDGSMVYRHFPELDTAGAAVLARILRGISLARFGESTSTAADWLIRAAATADFNRPDVVLGMGAMLDRARVAGPDPEIESIVGDVLHPVTLTRRFPMLQVFAPQRGVVLVVFPGGELVIARDPDLPGITAILTLNEPEDVAFLPELSAEHVLLVLAALDGVAVLSRAELELRGGNPELLARQRSELLGLVTGIRADDDVARTYERLISIIAPHGVTGSLESVSPVLWEVSARTAIASCAARSGQSRLARSVDLGRLRAVTNREPTVVGDEYRLRFDCGELLFSIKGDVAVGWGRVIGTYRQLSSLPLVSNASALEWHAWAMSARDLFGAGAVPPWLVLYTWRCLILPWSVGIDETAWIVSLFRQMADHGGSEASDKARLVLARRPTLTPFVQELCHEQYERAHSHPSARRCVPV
jgi:hypothetical protein